MKWRVRISLEASAQNPSLHRNCLPEAALGEVATGRPGHGHWLSIFLLLLHSRWVGYFYPAGISDNPHTDGLSLFYFRNTNTACIQGSLAWHGLGLELSPPGLSFFIYPETWPPESACSEQSLRAEETVGGGVLGMVPGAPSISV